ncbi:MAG: hypothetical protein CNLJKLNK_00873 [Holosporales bacterium]
MLRGSTVSFGCIAFAVGIVLFRIKYEVVDLENRHIQILKSIQSTKESVHLLNAEWAHLTDPARIQRLATKYLDNATALPDIISPEKKKKEVPTRVDQKVKEKKATVNKAAPKPASLDDLLESAQAHVAQKKGD